MEHSQLHPISLTNSNKFTLDALNAELSIAKSSLLSLIDGWAGNGSVSYKMETFKKVKYFLIYLFADFWYITKKNLAIPTIYPGTDGDIDIEWDTDNLSILISVPEIPSEKIGVFGKNPTTNQSILLDFDISDTEKIDEFLIWLKEQY